MAKSTLVTGLKFRRLMRALPEVERPHLVGHLDLMWLTAWDSSLVAFRSPDEVELAAEWSGAPGEYATALLSVGFLDQTDLGLEIHDWWDHAPDYFRRRKAILLLAIQRGYDVPAQWLKDRGLRGSGRA